MSPWSKAPIEVTDDLKRAFAKALLKNIAKPVDAAISVFDGDFNELVVLGNTLANDIDVRAYMLEIKDEEGPASYIPTREQVALEVLNLARKDKQSRDGKEFDVPVRERLDAYKLFGDFMGYIQRPDTVTNINNNVGNTVQVMRVVDHGSDDDWEATLRSQQAKLVHDATATRQ